MVVPLEDIQMVCHLVPQYETLDKDIRVDPDTDLLDVCHQFWFNHYSSYFTNSLVNHWRENP